MFIKLFEKELRNIQGGIIVESFLYQFENSENTKDIQEEKIVKENIIETDDSK